MTGVFRPYENYTERKTRSGETKIPWLMSLPEHWDLVRSKRLFVTRKERARTDDDQLSATQAYGVIPQKDFEDKVGRKVVRINQHLEKRAHVEPDDFVISMRSFQGGLERAWTRGCIRSSYVVLNPSPLVHIGYFAHLFKSRDYISALRATSNFIRDGQDLNFRNFCLVDLPLPPQEEQDQIAHFLDWKTAQIGKFIRNKRRLIELLKEQKQNVINRAVTRGLDPDVALKPSGVEWIGDIPKHWESRRLKTIAAVVLGKMLKTTPSKDDQLKPYLRSANIQWFEPNISDVASMWFSQSEMKQYRISKDDILVSEGGEVGRACIWHEELEECYIQNSVHKVSAGAEILPLFLLYQFSSFSGKGAFKAVVNRVSIAHLTREKLVTVLFCKPPIEEQKAIIAHIQEKTAEIDQTISRAEREIELIREYRTRLISDVVTGKVDVRGVEAPEILGEEPPEPDEDAGESDDVIDDGGDMDEND